MSTTQKYKVTIDGQSYTIMSDEPEVKLEHAVDYLNGLLKEVKQKNPTRERYQTAIFAALQLTNRLIQFEQDSSALNSACQSLIQQVDEALSL